LHPLIKRCDEAADKIFFLNLAKNVIDRKIFSLVCCFPAAMGLSVVCDAVGFVSVAQGAQRVSPERIRTKRSRKSG
jgi:hypothetical protein